MTTKVETGGGAHFGGTVSSGGGDVVGRDQIKLNLIGDVSAEQIEAVLPTLRTLLARPDTELQPETGQESLRLTNPNGASVLLSAQAAEALFSAASRRGEPDEYLGALLVHPRYSGWARRYVPLAGTVTETKIPAGWHGIEPELTALEASGEGAQRQVKRVPLRDVTQAVARHNAWVLLGEPGSGKTTTLYRLLIDLARERLQTGEGRMPLLLSLADYRDYPSPYDFVAAVWRQRVGMGDLEERLRAGGLFLLADALNEMPFSDGPDYRDRVGAWRRFVTEWPGNRLVFTCRSRDYSQPLGLPEVEIERLDIPRVKTFLRRYLSEELAAAAWDRLDGSPLLDLVRNPFYLYILCWLVAAGEAWPTGRADLFRGFVGYRLRYEESLNHPDWPGKDALTGALAILAEGMQRLGEGTRLPRKDVIERLPKRVETHDGPVDTDPEVLLRLGLAATLLDAELDPIRGEVVRFYHHQLQEYFAALSLLGAFGRGRDLAERWRRPRLKREMPDLGPLRDDEPLPPPPTTGWEEPTLLAVGLAGKPEALIAAARMVEPEALMAAVRTVEPVLAARCLTEPGMAPVPGEIERTREALLASMADPAVHLRARNAAGEALGRLGDSRFETIEVEGAKVLLPPLVDIPAGEVTLGSSRLEVWRLARRVERPRHRLRLLAFGIGKYPVTNAEYACFIADGGYENERWWDTGQARAWRRGELTASYVEDWLNNWRAVKDDPSIMQRQGWSEYNIAQWTKLLGLEEEQVRAAVEKHGAERPMDTPEYWTDERFDNPSQPVVGITWFEARAYCNWLGARWRAAGVEVSRPLGERGAASQ